MKFKTPKVSNIALFPRSAINSGIKESQEHAQRHDKIRSLAGGKNKRRSKKTRKSKHRKSKKKGGSKSCGCGSTPAKVITYPSGGSNAMSPNPNANISSAQQIFANSVCASTGDAMGDSWGQAGGSNLGRFMENLNNMAGGYETSNENCPSPLKGCFTQDDIHYGWVKFPHPDESEDYDYFALVYRNTDIPDEEDEDAWQLVNWFGYENLFIKIRMEKGEDGKYLDHFPDSIPDPESLLVVDGPFDHSPSHYSSDSDSEQEGGKKKKKRKSRKSRKSRKGRYRKRGKSKRKRTTRKKRKSRKSRK
jgi:hypothetical protein